MAENSLSREFNRLYLRLQKRLKRLYQRGNTDDIHLYRTACNQIEAFCKWCMGFMKESDSNELARWLSGYKSLYKKIGKIRTTQLMLKAGRKLDIWHEIPFNEAELKRSRKVLRKEFKLFLEKFRKSSSNKVFKIIKKYDFLPTSFLAENKLIFIQGNSMEAMQKMKLQLKIPWHEARLLMRTNFYLIKLSKSEETVFSDNLLLKDKKLVKDLGVWHEWVELHQYLTDKRVSALPVITLLKNTINTIEKEIINSLHLEEDNSCFSHTQTI